MKRATISRWLDHGTHALGRALTRGGRAVVEHVRKHPHATVACVAAVTPPIVDVTLGPVAGKAAEVVADVVIVGIAVHAAHEITRARGVSLDLALAAGLAARKELKSDLRASAIVAVASAAVSFVPVASVAVRALEAARAVDRAFRIVSIARAEAIRLALAA